MERRELEVRIPGLPSGLDGVRVAHLSDLHLGTISLSGRALERAVEWVEEIRPEIVGITGDLVTRHGGEATLERALTRLTSASSGVFAVLGNHDVDDSRDPFVRPADLTEVDAPGAELLRDDARTVVRDRRRIQVVGVDPTTYRAGRSRPAERADRDADLRILLCHFPEVVRTLPTGIFHVVLAGHYHGGQLAVPTPWGKVRLKDLRATYREGIYEAAGGTMHVSRGLGTSLVPFRLLARPEATVLTVRRAE